ncbi:autotransporter-associated beta strand repeat-containing protein [Luteolibacter yonseiensis]|uniref:Autotransporter-associated beta strand repeat-containing protein n=1 Tax=Luteolibacter yonseiensis TaxID=1144680 RepID=A0A934RB06_9BACT|nr:autotransporter-associated beta strand repeat-containing protein [Luteolibacter yonseiensis]MBK1818425.1 autotransporter-associated beta strand repeat-containing protein [Luteolibacter yonseiensis]
MIPRLLYFSLLAILPAAAQIPAFPGAEGFGAYATGGRGGDVYYVTNLNASGAGSLRNGVETAPSNGRTIVFAVSGYIPLPGGIAFRMVRNKITIAGQTAPGDGIGLRNGTVRVSGNNTVLRHLRIRHGKNGSGGDCIDLDSSASNSIIDHISMMFSTDENISFFNSALDNFTMQYSTSSWGMERHNAGGLWDLRNGSCHHTLWAHHRTRNPKARPAMLEWINNVTYHWRNEGFIMGDSETPANWKANVIGNYYISINDPDTGYSLRNKGLTKARVASNNVPNFSLYLADTLHDADGDGVLNGTDKGYGIVDGAEFAPGDAVGANRYYKSATPFPGATGGSAVRIDGPLTAYKKVLSASGALRLDANHSGLLRDELDTLLVDSVVNQQSILVQKDGNIAGETTPGNGEANLANPPYNITNYGFGTLNGTTPPTDVDLDGMPDAWESTLNGVNGMAYNVSGDDHNNVFTAGQLGNTFFPAGTPVGYTYLEEYLHFLAVPHATVVKNVAGSPSSQTVNLRKYTEGFTKSPAYTVSGVVNGTVLQFLADGTTPSATGPVVKFIPTPNATGRAGFLFTVVDADGSQWTQQFALLISSASAPRDLIWNGDGSTNAWNDAAANWKQPSGALTAFATGDTALFDDRGSATPAVNITTSQTSGSVLVTGTKNYTFGGSGSLASTGTLTKAGDTKLTLATPVSFSLGSFLNGGETVLNPGGGLAGGTIRFSGGSTLTSAYGNTTLGINPNIQVDAGSVGNINLSQRVELNGSLSGGGIFNIFSPSNLGTEGRVYLDGASAGCTGTVNLSGGATSPGNAGRIAFRANGGSFNGFGSARVNLSGIDLFTTNNSGGNTYPIGQLGGDANSRLRSNYLNGGGATTWSVGGLGTSSTFAGAIMDGTRADGSNSPTLLTKTGGGTLTITGTNIHSGATTVSGGTLAVDGALSLSPVTVGGGATLVGNGTFGGLVTINSGARINPGNSATPYRALPANGGLTVSSGTLVYDLSSNPGGTNDRITVAAGTSTNLSGTVNFQLNFVDGSLGAGVYNLIDGGATQSVSGLTMVPVLPAPTGTTRQTFSLSRPSSGTTPGYVKLTVTGNAGNLTWTGVNGGIWDLNATAGNWSGASPDTFSNLDLVTFPDGAASGSVSLAGTLQPARVTAANNTLAYTLGGSGVLGGVGGLIKSGGGIFTIGNSAANTFSGGTTLNAGTLRLANTNTPLGTGVIAVNGGTLSFPSAIFLSNSMVFTGNSRITNTGGNSAILNPTTGTLSSVGNANIDLSGVEGILSINGPMDGFSGTLSFGSGSGTVRLNSNSSAAADVNFGSADTHFDLGTGSAYLNNRNGGIVIHLGAVSGGGNTHLDGRQSGSGNTVTTYVVGGLDTSTTFAGTISNAGDLSGLDLVKTGSGTWTLGGNSNFTGGFRIESGTLAIAGKTISSAETTVAEGAALVLSGGTFGAESVGGRGLISGHGTIAADLNPDGVVIGRGFATGTPGTLVVTGNASFDSSSVMKLRGGVSSDLLAVAGDLQLAGSIQIALAPETTFGRYPLLTCGGELSGDVSLTGVPAGVDAHLSLSAPGRVDLVIDDSDEDGLPDSWEAFHFGNLARLPDGDDDGDGQDNAVEYLAGTNPSSGISRFAATLSPLDDTRFALSWPSIPGKIYQIQTSGILLDGWSPLTTVPGSAAPAKSTSYSVVRTGGGMFYRVAIIP